MEENSTTQEATEWTPHEQRWRVCTGYMEREEGRLQVRANLQRGEGICNVLFEEDDETIAVLILACGDHDSSSEEWMDCPTHIYLERPLGEREVVDMLRGGLPVPYRNVYEDMEREGILIRNPDGNGFLVDPEWAAAKEKERSRNRD